MSSVCKLSFHHGADEIKPCIIELSNDLQLALGTQSPLFHIHWNSTTNRDKSETFERIRILFNKEVRSHRAKTVFENHGIDVLLSYDRILVNSGWLIIWTVFCMQAIIYQQKHAWSESLNVSYAANLEFCLCARSRSPARHLSSSWMWAIVWGRACGPSPVCSLTGPSLYVQ